MPRLVTFPRTHHAGRAVAPLLSMQLPQQHRGGDALASLLQRLAIRLMEEKPQADRAVAIRKRLHAGEALLLLMLLPLRQLPMHHQQRLHAGKASLLQPRRLAGEALEPRPMLFLEPRHAGGRVVEQHLPRGRQGSQAATTKPYMKLWVGCLEL